MDWAYLYDSSIMDIHEVVTKQEGEIESMAKNTGNGYRRGAVDERSQVVNPKTGHYTKRNDGNGQFLDNKKDNKPFKGVRKEK
jgi:hypothetical protein